MADYQVTIRLVEDKESFVYSILLNDRVYESRVIETEEEEVAAGYYGGSEAMD